MRHSALLLLSCVLAVPAGAGPLCGQGEARGRFLIVMLARLTEQEERGLNERLAELKRTDPGFRGASFRLRNRGLRSQATLPIGWDLALGFPVPALAAAAGNKRLLELGAKGSKTFYRVLWILPYGPLGAGGSLPWAELLDGRRSGVLLPDPIVEPEFGEVLAALYLEHGPAALRALRDSGEGLSLLDSNGIRGRIAADANRIGVVALAAGEYRAGLPAGRIGIAVSARARRPELVRRLASLLATPEWRSVWWLRKTGLLPSETKDIVGYSLPTASQVTTAERLWRSEQPPELDEPSPWITTLLFLGFGLGFLWILIVAARRH